MCGIAGIIGKTDRRFDKTRYISKIEKMLDSIKYRGPDENGVKELDNCVLGHVRLSIIDLKGGSQPMSANDNQKCLVFNGEIYGYKDIKKTLTNYIFENDSDTEVILALNEEYSEKKEMLKNLPGMFAFGLWDNRKKELLCARDRFGEKPFYYAIGNNGEFVFASEIKSIIASGLIEPQINTDALRFFVKHSWIYPNSTIYSNIYTLPPAHYLIFHDGNICVDRYWDLPTTNENLTLQEAAEEFDRLFRQAVAKQTVSDVPIGAFLSGGLDSGSVVAQMAQIVPQVTTIAFSATTGFDESPLAATMAEKYHTNHIVVKDNLLDISDVLFKMQTIFDEPFADPAAIPAYSIAKEARKYVKVILSGDAGDEMLGGYANKYRRFYYANEMRKSTIPIGLQKAFWDMSWARQIIIRKAKFSMGADVAQTVFHGTKLADTNIRRNATRLAKHYPNDVVDFYHKTNMSFVSDKELELMGLGPLENIDYFQTGFVGDKGELDNLVRCDLLEYLPGNGLLKTDRTTMAVSLESRTPFCDVDLAEFCIALPFRLKISDKTDKIVLRKSMEKYWTKEISNNIKTGFSPPWDKWLALDEVKEIEHEYIYKKNSPMWNYLDYDNAIAFLNNNNGWARWIFLNLGLWFGTRN